MKWRRQVYAVPPFRAVQLPCGYWYVEDSHGHNSFSWEGRVFTDEATARKLASDANSS